MSALMILVPVITAQELETAVSQNLHFIYIADAATGGSGDPKSPRGSPLGGLRGCSCRLKPVFA